jgi:hypothetical protein
MSVIAAMAQNARRSLVLIPNSTRALILFLADRFLLEVIWQVAGAFRGFSIPIDRLCMRC